MRTITKEINIYKFEELKKEVQEKIIERWNNNDSFEEYLPLSEVLEFYNEQLETDEKQPLFKYFKPDNNKIFYSGFYSQGDGLCFDRANENHFSPMIEHFIRDNQEIFPILSIRKDLNQLDLEIKRNSYSSNYCHSKTRYIEIIPSENFIENNFNQEISKELELLTKKLSLEYIRVCDNLYSFLKINFDYWNSEEFVKSEIKSNETEFLEDGSIFSE